MFWLLLVLILLLFVIVYFVLFRCYSWTTRFLVWWWLLNSRNRSPICDDIVVHDCFHCILFSVFVCVNEWVTVSCETIFRVYGGHWHVWVSLCEIGAWIGTEVTAVCVFFVTVNQVRSVVTTLVYVIMSWWDRTWQGRSGSWRTWASLCEVDRVVRESTEILFVRQEVKSIRPVHMKVSLWGKMRVWETRFVWDSKWDRWRLSLTVCRCETINEIGAAVTNCVSLWDSKWDRCCCH